MKSNMYVSEGVLFSAFRYALSRQTYVVNEVAEALEENAFVLTDKLRHQIMVEIDAHIRSQGVDVALVWQRAHRTLGDVDELNDDDPEDD